MSKEPLIFIQHILESIELIESFSSSTTKAEFFKNKMMQSAIIRQIEVIGEAVKNLPKDFTSKYPTVPWKDVVGTRDKMIHHYFGVDLDFIYGIITKNIPELKKEIIIILKDHKK